MAVMRAQVSLMFDDADLYDNFIIPCKEERRLNGIIVKCLKAYYENAQVRSLVEGAQDEEEAAMEGVQSTQSICDSIRASLIMQDFLVEELKQSVDSGMEDVEGILSQANTRAESQGFGASYQTKSGSTILQLEAPKQQTQEETPSSGENVPAPAPNNLAAILCQAVLLMAKDSNNSQVVALLQQAGVDQTAVTPAPQPETPRQTEPTQAVITHAEPKPTFVESEPVVHIAEGNDFDEGSSIHHEPVAIEAKPVEKPVEEDATDAMKDFFSSL